MLEALMGWLGTLGTFGAYVLLWRGRLHSTSLRYALLNAVGGLLAGTAAVLYGAWPAAASNYIWAAVGLQTLVTTIHRRVADGRGGATVFRVSRRGRATLEPAGPCLS